MSRERFEALLAPALRGVRTLVQRRAGRFGQTEDILQEVLLRAYSRRNQLRSEANFRQWLWSIALNEIRAFYRRDRGLLSLEELPGFDVPDPAMSPMAAAEQTQTRRWVRACVAKLPQRYRAAVHARDFEDRSFRDAAAALRRTVPATKTAYFRARRRLADIMTTGTGREAA